MLDRLRRHRLPLAGGLFVIVAVVVTLLATRSDEGPRTLNLGELQAAIDDGEIASATIVSRRDRVQGELTGGEEFVVNYPAEYEAEVTTALLDAGLDPETDNQTDPLWMRLLLSLLPVLLIMGVLIYLVTSL